MVTEIAKGLKSRYIKTLLSVYFKLNLYYIEKIQPSQSTIFPLFES